MIRPGAIGSRSRLAVLFSAAIAGLLACSSRRVQVAD
jgi:hypothetical protein